MGLKYIYERICNAEVLSAPRLTNLKNHRKGNLSMNLKSEAFALLKEWCDTLLTYKVNINSPYLKNSLLCPSCGIVHGRIGDLVFPLVYLYKESGEVKYFEAARELIRWTDENLTTDDGLIRNDLSNQWKGIAAFSAMALGETLYRFGDVIDPETKEYWHGLFMRITNALTTYFGSDKFKPNINYYAGAAALFAFAYRYTGEESFLALSYKWGNLCREHFDADGLLMGEGKPLDHESQKGCHFIDMGYNLEESMPLLIMQAHYLGDAELIAYYADRAKDHLEFLLPDGAIDNSFGTRHNKWTYYGSRTSDGLVEGYVLIAKRDPVFKKAVVRSIEMLKACTHGGLLASGTMAHTAGEPTCIHHTFTHAKALTAVCLEADEIDFSNSEAAVLPRERDGVRSFQGGNLYTATCGGFTATVNASDLIAYSGAENTGGAMTLLWHRSRGAILAATTHTFILSEPTNMQYDRTHSSSPTMTPRITDGKYSSDCDLSVRLTCSGDVITATSEAYPSVIKYRLTEEYTEIRVRSEREGEYILPIISPSGEELSAKANDVHFNDALTVTASKAPNLSRERFWHPVGAFQYVPLTYKLSPGEELVIKITVACDK